MTQSSTQFHSSRFPRGVIAVMLAVAGLMITQQNTLASWAYVPQEVRMAEADLVVAGKIEKLAEDVVKDGTAYEVGVIKASKILKGRPKMFGDIRLAWPKPRPGGLRLSTDLPAPRVGESSIWVLRADEKLPVYWATYPTDRQPIEKLDEVKKRLATLKQVKWSKTVGGLQIGLFVEQHDMRKSTVRIDGKPVKAVARLSVYPLMKNAGAKPMHLVNYRYDEPFTLDFTGPDGKPIDVNLYGTAPPRKPAPRKHNFIALEPGQIRTIGYGFGLPMLTKGGQYTVTLGYKNRRDSKPLDFDNVWLGETAAPTVKVAVAD